MAEEAAASTGRVEAFSDRVLTVFATSVFTTGIGIVIGFVLARILGPAGKGDFYLITLLPVTLMVLTQFGLPQAFGYYAAQGKTAGINAKTVLLAIALAGPAVGITLALLPVIRAVFMSHVEPGEIVLGIVALPFLLWATFTTGVVLGRQQVRWYSFVNVVYTLGSLVVFLLFIAVFDWGVVGALVASLAMNALQAVLFFIASLRITGEMTDRRPVSYRELFRFGLPLYPGSLTQHFSIRVDVYLIAALVPDPAAPLGYYSMAVTMAQLALFLPLAVSSLFFPHVAGSARDDADRQVPMLSRVTLLLTAGMAILIIPASVIFIRVFLPAFEASIPPLIVLLPGVVALSLTEVLSSYVAGVGSAGWTSAVKTGSLVVNLVANLILIPRYGIVGAALASLISYTGSAIVITFLAARLSRRSVASFWIPRASDIRFTIATATGMGVRVLRRGTDLRSPNRP